MKHGTMMLERQQVEDKLATHAASFDESKHPILSAHPAFASSVHANRVIIASIRHKKLDWGGGPIVKPLLGRLSLVKRATPESLALVKAALERTFGKRVLNPGELKPIRQPTYFVHALTAGGEKVLLALPNVDSQLNLVYITENQHNAYLQLLKNARGQ